MRLKTRKKEFQKKPKNRINLIMYLLFCTFVLSLSVGYAALNREIKISGEAAFRVEEDIRVTDINLSETINKGLENYTPDYSKDTIKMGVDLNEVTSEVVYNVEITNSGNVAMWIDSIEAPVNNNTNMEYVLEGIGIKELMQPGDIKEFKVRIKYKEGITLPENTNLDIVIKFNFTKPESILAQGNTGDASSTFYNGTIQKQEVETIEFLPTLEVGDNAIGSWDASYNKDGSVIAWYTDSDNNDLYELYIGGIGEIEAPVNSSYLFGNFSNLTSITFDDYFDTSKVTDMTGMFRYCSSINSLNLSSFDTSRVVYFSNTSLSGGMFYNCTSLTSLDLSSFDTSSATNMSSMFNNCTSLQELDLSSFDTSKVQYFGYNSYRGMFYNCSSLTKLDLSNFDTSSAINMNNMFGGCRNLTDIDVSHFNTSNVTDMAGTFANCSQLINLDLSTWDVSMLLIHL